MSSAVRPIVWHSDSLRLLDQRVLPQEERYLDCRSAGEVAEAIHAMAVRGAPAIGIAAAYGLVLAVRAQPEDFDRAFEVLAASRPTAVNLRWALERLRGVWLAQRSADALEAEAVRIHEEDLAQNLRMG
ncbi:MAG: S-methyl-5-thioribose-1-phosphate isomerase, partial [Hydrocarboniphaga effusa]|nr:S-methyl-5-thioribose-1-phosphate isomerase [Hydrocarboniphaga effusa]